MPRSSARIVVIGGGTGITACLRGLKSHTREITAIVTVADDGGSSGRLRKDYQMLAPGDARNCLVALATGDALLQDMFSYRFTDSILRGHSFGNLMLAVITQLSGSFPQALQQAGAILQCAGEVLPSTETRVVLVALHTDGSKSTGEQSISRSAKPIVHMELRPLPPMLDEMLAERIRSASVVVLGPGSLYTSILPNLLVPGMVEALSACSGRVVLVANIMTQPGETDGFDLERHVKSLMLISGLKRLDLVLASSTQLPTEALERYAESGAAPVVPPGGAITCCGVPLLVRPLSMVLPGGMVRHDSERLAAEVLAISQESCA